MVRYDDDLGVIIMIQELVNAKIANKSIMSTYS